MKVTKLILTIALISTAAKALACSCDSPPGTIEEVKESLEWADVVFEGIFVEDLTNGSNEEGINILFKVNAVYHGELEAAYVSIFQLYEDGCQIKFKRGEKYTVYGLSFTRIECSDSDQQIVDPTNDPPPPPPPVEWDGSIMTILNCSLENRIDYWNGLIQQRQSFSTNACGVFLSDSNTGRLFRAL